MVVVRGARGTVMVELPVAAAVSGRKERAARESESG